MRRFVIYMILALVPALAGLQDASAQAYRRETRRGNRDLSAGSFEKAKEHYRRVYGGDSVIAAINLAGAYHMDRTDSTRIRQNDTLALKALDEVKAAVEGTSYEADYYFNHGVVAASMEDWQTAVDDFKKVMILRPEDMQAKENYVYAKEHLQKEQQGGGGQDDQQEQDQEQEQEQEQNGQNDRQDQSGEDQPQDEQDRSRNDQEQSQPQPGDSRISPQQAQQILQAIQAKEKETQDKVEKKKAAVMKSKQKEKNW